MPPEPLPIDRKDVLKDRKPSSSEPVEIVPARWRDSPTTPSSHYNNRGSPSSCRWGGGGEFRRPFTGHGKSVGGWHITSVESGPPVSVDSGYQKDPKGGDSRETSASPNGNSHLQSDFVNPWDQHAKSSGDGVSTTGDQRLEKAVSLGSSLDWKPLKWIRSGSLSSRGSGFSHLGSCKVIGVDPLDTKIDVQPGAATLVQSPSGDASTCVTPNTPDEANSRKKARLGWGEGLAKYEKKKVDPDDVVEKENGSKNVTVNGVSSSESLLPSTSFPGKSPSLTGNSESVSPVTSCSFACSLSPGLEEKASVVATTVDNDTCNPCVGLSHNINQIHGLTFNLENFNLAEDFNVSSSLDELLKIDNAIVPRSDFAMDKLQVWKADISRTIEITESEIDSLEHELKSLISDEDEDSCPATRASSSFLKPCSNNNISVDIPMKKATCTDSVGSAVYLGRDDTLYGSVLETNKITANTTSGELSKLLLPTTNLCTSIARSTSTNYSLIKKRISTRKRFSRFKERVFTLKFRAFQYSWKETLHLLSVRSGAKSQKKFETSSRLGYIDSQKQRTSNHSRSSTPGGCLRLVPTKEVVEYASKLLLDSRVKICRNEQKMPTFILDTRERTSSKFVSDNGLVENPIDVEKERSIVNRWTEEDKQTFLDKYALYGKNFKKIASFFQHKTVADCVEFYYKNHKSESFQNTKKNSKFAKGKSCETNTNSTYLVTHGKRLNRETGATSLDMLGAASAMVANVHQQYCNEQETVAADVLAGICGSISSEALGSCVTSSVDHQKLGRSCSSLNDVDEETCSDNSCGEDFNLNEGLNSVWTDEERGSFVKAVKTYGKDFTMISRCVGTRSSDQCKVFFSKVKKCFGLDVLDLGVGSEGVANQGGGGDQDDTCTMVDSGSGSGISNDKSSMECKMEAEDLHSEPELVVPKVGGNLEGAADSEAASLNGSPQNTCSRSDSASGAKVDEHETVETVVRSSEDLNSVSFYSRGSSLSLNLTTPDHGTTLDLNAASENVTSFPEDSNSIPPQRKAVSSQDDVSSRLTFRKSGQTNHKRSLSSNEPQSQLKLDESLLLPIDGCIQMGTDLTHVSQQQRRSSSLEIEKPSKSGDVKLFGQIITNHHSSQENKNPDAGKSKSYNLKFEQNERNYGLWDANRIQTGYSSLPGSAVLLAKYPAAFSNISTLPKLDHNRGPGYHPYSQPFTVDKLLDHNVGGMNMNMNVVGGVCNGVSVSVSDPVAAIRMHYAKTEQYKNGGAESWRGNVSDIGSR